MIKVNIPGYEALEIEHVVLDYNGTLAVDGTLIPGAAERLVALSKRVSVRVVTADTFGKVRAQLDGFPIQVTVLPSENIHLAKLAFIRALGPEKTVAIGNGRNDREMLKHAALGICVCQREGCAVETLQAADILVTHIADALQLLEEPLRLVATLRS